METDWLIHATPGRFQLLCHLYIASLFPLLCCLYQIEYSADELAVLDPTSLVKTNCINNSIEAAQPAYM